MFFLWQGYLGRAQDRGSTSVWTPPPLVRNELWSRAQGRFIAIQFIVFFTWCSFLSNNFWVRVCCVFLVHMCFVEVTSVLGSSELVLNGRSCPFSFNVPLSFSCSIRTMLAFPLYCRWFGCCLASWLGLYAISSLLCSSEGYGWRT